MEIDTLKKCPHCGGLAALNSNYSWRTKGYFVCVRCDICGSQGKSYFSDDAPAETDWSNIACRDAVNAWNMRYTEDK